VERRRVFRRKNSRESRFCRRAEERRGADGRSRVRGVAGIDRDSAATILVSTALGVPKKTPASSSEEEKSMSKSVSECSASAANDLEGGKVLREGMAGAMRWEGGR
jgi:hypothetical protein